MKKKLVIIIISICFCVALGTILFVKFDLYNSIKKGLGIETDNSYKTRKKADNKNTLKKDKDKNKEKPEENKVVREKPIPPKEDVTTQLEDKQAKINSALSKLNLNVDIRGNLEHGEKTAQYQKYIVLHCTEGEGSAEGVVNYWSNNGTGVGAHFVINKDGSIVQCVNLDKIAHHAGYGDTGHNEQYGVIEDGRDDMVGTTPIGDWASDYGMNAWSIGIELVHTTGNGGFPEEQLAALDNLIEYIDAYYGNGGTIIDHKMWRSGNSDTSPEFAGYFENYKQNRKH